MPGNPHTSIRSRQVAAELRALREKTVTRPRRYLGDRAPWMACPARRPASR
jgi:hypothetical protein